MYQGTVPLKGDLSLKVIRQRQKAPRLWRLRNTLRWGYVWGLLTVLFAKGFSRVTGIPTLTSELSLVVRCADGTTIDYGIVGRRVVTDVGADAVADAFRGAYTLSNFNYHGIGTDSTAEAAGDTALGAESTTALNPNSTRATGTQSQPASKQYRSVGVLTADAQIIVREHGLFSTSGTGTGDLFDRTVFATVTLEDTDSISATYTLSTNSGS